MYVYTNILYTCYTYTIYIYKRTLPTGFHIQLTSSV